MNKIIKTLIVGIALFFCASNIINAQNFNKNAMSNLITKARKDSINIFESYDKYLTATDKSGSDEFLENAYKELKADIVNSIYNRLNKEYSNNLFSKNKNKILTSVQTFMHGFENLDSLKSIIINSSDDKFVEKVLQKDDSIEKNVLIPNLIKFINERYPEIENEIINKCINERCSPINKLSKLYQHGFTKMLGMSAILNSDKYKTDKQYRAQVESEWLRRYTDCKLYEGINKSVYFYSDDYVKIDNAFYGNYTKNNQKTLNGVCLIKINKKWKVCEFLYR